MNEQLLLAGLFILGAVCRVVLPYLQVYLNRREPFDWRRVVGQIIAAAIVIIPALTGLSDELAQATHAGAVVIGWGAADIGRFAQKLTDRARGKSEYADELATE